MAPWNIEDRQQEIREFNVDPENSQWRNPSMLASHHWRESHKNNLSSPIIYLPHTPISYLLDVWIVNDSLLSWYPKHIAGNQSED